MKKALNYIIDDTFDRWLQKSETCEKSINTMRVLLKEWIHDPYTKEFDLKTLWFFKEGVEY